MAHPHLRERGTVRRVSDPVLGEFDIPGFPVKFSAWQPDARPRAARLGENNETVLQEILGLSDTEISQLYDAGVLVQDGQIPRGRRETP